MIFDVESRLISKGMSSDKQVLAVDSALVCGRGRRSDSPRSWTVFQVGGQARRSPESASWRLPGSDTRLEAL